jgi:hypothetical protein
MGSKEGLGAILLPRHCLILIVPECAVPARLLFSEPAVPPLVLLPGRQPVRGPPNARVQDVISV